MVEIFRKRSEKKVCRPVTLPTVDGNTNVRTCLDVPETHLVGVLVVSQRPPLLEIRFDAVE